MHIPVLLNEVICFLDPQSNQNFIDCTLGNGGHTVAILEKTAPSGKVLAIDLASEATKKFQQRAKEGGLGKRVILVNDNFARLKEIVQDINFGFVSGILLDLGLSSEELEQSGRGFSFLRDEPLNMRFGDFESRLGEDRSTAEFIVNRWPFEELVRIFRDYGEERDAYKITKAIDRKRRVEKIRTTKQLVEIILSAKYQSLEVYPHHRIHPATRIFQALRIAVNRELENLKQVLPSALEVLSPGGRIAVISFHSLEDRIVKNFFRDQKQAGAVNVLTKKPVVPTEEEVRNNPRSRSAKLRVAEKRGENK